MSMEGAKLTVCIVQTFFSLSQLESSSECSKVMTETVKFAQPPH